MSKIKLMLNLVEDIRAFASTLEEVVKITIEENNTLKEESEVEKNITLEEVRAALSSKIKEGFTEEVRSIINFYGCNKLSEIDSKYYEEILQKVENIDI
ncbi:hypothetical protein [Terrisporobacter sp.]